jgi:hypothetical protein
VTTLEHIDGEVITPPWVMPAMACTGLYRVVKSGRVVEVTFKGEADSALSEMFDCLDVTVDRGTTHLRVAPGDAAALHGILGQLDALGLELISVREL